MQEVIILSSGYQPIGKVSVERAICLLYLEKAYSVKDSDKVVRSVSKTIPIPLVLILPDTKYVKLRNVAYSANAVKKRDNYTCVYCGKEEKKDLTIDHLIPRTRWEEIKAERDLEFSLNSFQNCVSSCKPCNQKKSNKLLVELGWPEIKPQKPLSPVEIDWGVLFS